uniref:Putative secreted protein n=1 Tax=Anopheles darlingi TaxID=43151 RepID=A0A2M4D7M3_ANODA
MSSSLFFVFCFRFSTSIIANSLRRCSNCSFSTSTICSSSSSSLLSLVLFFRITSRLSRLNCSMRLLVFMMSMLLHRLKTISSIISR